MVRTSQDSFMCHRHKTFIHSNLKELRGAAEQRANKMDNQRELDIQALCQAVKDTPLHCTGDYGSGYECVFCSAPAWYKDDMSTTHHKPDCAYLIAKDLSAGM